MVMSSPDAMPVPAPEKREEMTAGKINQTLEAVLPAVNDTVLLPLKSTIEASWHGGRTDGGIIEVAKLSLMREAEELVKNAARLLEEAKKIDDERSADVSLQKGLRRAGA
jgi:hypothetical protein